MFHALESAPPPDSPVSECCPQCPVLSSPAQLLQTHAYGFFYGVNPSQAWFSSFPEAFYFPQHYCLF